MEEGHDKSRTFQALPERQTGRLWTDTPGRTRYLRSGHPLNDHRNETMISFVVNILVGFIGTIVGGVVTWVIGVRQRRLVLVLQMHRDFNSAEMVEIRHQASEFLESHPGLSLRELRAQHGWSLMKDVWSVQFFYQRLWLLIQYRQVDPHLVSALFGDILSWWVQRYFLGLLFPLETEQAKHIEQLWVWIQKNSTPQQRQQWNQHIDSDGGATTT
jgi:hypothetical protein